MAPDELENCVRGHVDAAIEEAQGLRHRPASLGLAFERRAVARVKRLMTVAPELPVYSVNAPSFVPGVDFSDQWSFWRFGYPAVMVTDTAFYRYAHYHTAGDTPDKVDYERTARVVAGLASVVADLAGEPNGID